MKSIAVEEYWFEVGTVTDIAEDVKYPLLSRLGKSILIILRGNADIRREKK